ncbi:copper resistance CopC/CopD family protein [Plantactinospora sp. KBS50]|uniref:copper resistance CopC/CopD family protein n=1 Tax=Plantactinospora sp. KBS50 TaxID=2024580 RepID=UPI000BAAA8E0|nr:copper resistance protein CopC [Plantactinospora sp. KBS50]ASW54831.1 hypothetical protein CIK06_12520 [Plantactinospora sp. KBS50]
MRPREHATGPATVRIAGRAAVRVLLVALAALFASLAGPARPASAHAVLSTASPEQGSVVPAPPERVLLVFNEPVTVVPGRTQVVGPDGKRLNVGDPVRTPRGLEITVRATSRPLGTYLVSYRVISADSHPVSGAFTFSVGAPSASAPTADTGTDPVVRAAVPAAKYLGYLGLTLSVGPLLMLAWWYPRRLPRRGPLRLVRAGLGLVALGALASFWVQAPSSSGAGLFDVSGVELAQIARSGFGVLLLIRLLIVAAVAALVGRVRRGGTGRWRGAALVGLGLAGLLTWPLTGHPVASPHSALLIAADLTHLATMAIWLGGLVFLGAFLLRRADRRELRLVLPRWSRLAAVAVYWLVMAGLLQALVQVGTLSALVGSGYGRLLLVKTALLGATLGVAAVSRRLVRRHTAPDRPGALSRLVRAEVGITTVVLAVSAVLVQTNPGRTIDVEAVAAARAEGFSTTLTSPLYSLQFEVFPATVGEYNALHAFVYTPEGKPLPVLEWTVTAALPERGIEPVDNPVASLLGNQGLGNVTFPLPGRWELSLTLRTSDIDQATVKTTVDVR